jgi:hypothetical protein
MLTCKRDVAEILLGAGMLADMHENAHLVKVELTEFRFITVVKYLR